jgi:hypothetical protein
VQSVPTFTAEVCLKQNTVETTFTGQFKNQMGGHSEEFTRKKAPKSDAQN